MKWGKKNIVHYVTAQYMRQNKRRTVITYLGIVFMVLLMTCVFVGKDTAINYVEQVSSLKDGKWHVSIYDVAQKELSKITSLSYVDETAVSAGYGFTAFEKSRNETRPYLNIKAYTVKCFDWMNIRLMQGTLPQNGNELVISKSALDDGADIKIGDTIRAKYFKRSITGTNKDIEVTKFPFYDIDLKYGETVKVPDDFPYYEKNSSFRENADYTGEEITYKVVGFIDTPGYEKESAAGYTAITFLDKDKISGLNSFNISVILNLKKFNSQNRSELYEIAGKHEIDFNNYVLVFSGNTSDSTINTVVVFMTIFFVLFVIAVTVILIYNVFNMSFQERSRYLGMLSSVGATARQKRSSIYYEAFHLLTAALPIGISLGLITVEFGMLAIRPYIGKLTEMEKLVNQCSVSLQISLSNMITIIAISIVTVLISSYLPARKIGKIGPIESIRGNAEKKSKGYKMNTRLVRWLGVEEMLAKNTVRRQRKKTKSIVAASVIFMVVIMVTTFGFVAIENIVSVKLNSSDMNMNYDRWDYLLCSTNGKNDKFEDLKTEVMMNQDVQNVAVWNEISFAGIVSSDVYSKEYWSAYHEICNLYNHRKLSEKEFSEWIPAEKMINILAADDTVLMDIAEKAGIDRKRWKGATSFPAIVVKEGELSTDSIVLDGKKAEKYRFFNIKNMTDVKVGDKMNVGLYSPKEDQSIDMQIEVAGFATAEQLKDYVSFHDHNIWLIVGDDTLQQIEKITGGTKAGMDIAQYILFNLKNSDAEIVNQLQNLSEDEEEGIIFTKADYRKTITDAISGVINILLFCFVLLTSMICLLNLFNSIRGRIIDRGKDFAMMESVGMTHGQIKKMMMYECLGIGIRAIIYAVVITVLLTELIKYGLIQIFGSVVFQTPIDIFVLTILVNMLVFVGMTLYCLRGNKSINILESIRNENV